MTFNSLFGIPDEPPRASLPSLVGFQLPFRDSPFTFSLILNNITNFQLPFRDSYVSQTSEPQLPLAFNSLFGILSGKGILGAGMLAFQLPFRDSEEAAARYAMWVEDFQLPFRDSEFGNQIKSQPSEYFQLPFRDSQARVPADQGAAQDFQLPFRDSAILIK